MLLRALLDSPLWLVAVIVTALMIVAAETGYRVGKHSAASDSGVGAVKAAVLALVGLLLAFSYSIAANHYDRRKYAAVEEAAAIINCWLRTDLADEPARSRARELLRSLVDGRLRRFDRSAGPPAVRRQIEADIIVHQRELWEIAAGQLRDSREPEKHMLLAQSVNDVIARGVERVSVDDHRVPPAVILLLTVSVLVSGFLIGLSSGQDNRRIPLLWAIVIILMVGVLITIVDIDNPNHGLITDPPGPLQDVKEFLTNVGG